MRSLICKSSAMLEVARRIERAAQADSPVLIWGEKGTGKKLVAELIHRQSRRGRAPLVVFSAADAAGRSAEEALFGTSEQPGALATAAGGTLLIDEIIGLPRAAQAKLLEAAERWHRAGLRNSDPRRIGFRLMATTRYSLSESVQRRALREDLSYRLAVVTIRVPSLRERKDDIPSLVRHILAECCAAHGRPVPSVERELMRYLVAHSWPANVGGLRDSLNKMVLAEDADVLTVDHLRGGFFDGRSAPANSPSPERIETLADLERAAVMRALKARQGNRTQAAKALGISVRTLQRKLKHWDVESAGLLGGRRPP